MPEFDSFSFFLCAILRSTACSDGLRYLSELLDLIRDSSSENADALRKLQPRPFQTSSCTFSPEGDSDDVAAKALRLVRFCLDYLSLVAYAKASETSYCGLTYANELSLL